MFILANLLCIVARGAARRYTRLVWPIAVGGKVRATTFVLLRANRMERFEAYEPAPSLTRSQTPLDPETIQKSEKHRQRVEEAKRELLYSSHPVRLCKRSSGLWAWPTTTCDCDGGGNVKVASSCDRKRMWACGDVSEDSRKPRPRSYAK
ncbi:hypothetical protein C8R45DRAFT_930548 [Mycena sanguinolenta]|nr:hypothetical protein C8R45DRAFT_930548 [Mycena sanguinolenta]